MPKESHPESLVFHFSLIEDPRIDRTKDHSLIDILIIALCAMLCGAESFVDFEEFGNAKLEFLRSFLALANGIPSHDTFRRVFAMLDPVQFSECFRHWTESLRQTIGAEIVAIDGKTLRRSHDRAKGKEPIHMVSAARPASSRPSPLLLLAGRAKTGWFSARSRPKRRVTRLRPFPNCGAPSN